MSLSPEQKRDIERFVREVLGCQCPDEVFRSIKAGPGPEPEPGLAVRKRIVVGDKLLIYLVENLGTVQITQAIESFVQFGVRDRDEHGLNRFRLVVAVEGTDASENEIEEVFQSFPLPDERIHLHVVSHLELP